MHDRVSLSNGNTAKTVAKDLNGRGFKNCFVIAGGYEGRGGWVSSKLPIKVGPGHAPATHTHGAYTGVHELQHGRSAATSAGRWQDRSEQGGDAKVFCASPSVALINIKLISSHCLVTTRVLLCPATVDHSCKATMPCFSTVPCGRPVHRPLVQRAAVASRPVICKSSSAAPQQV